MTRNLAVVVHALGIACSSLFAQVPFPCVDTAYLFQDEPITGMYSLSLGSGEYVISSSAIIGVGTNRQINGLGYNPVDNYIYGCVNGTSKVIRIHGDLSYQQFTVSGLPSTGPFNVGDIDDQGHLYLYGGGSTTIYVVDVSQGSPVLLTTLPTSATSIADWAYSPFDGHFYGLDVNHDFWRFNANTGVRDSIGHVVNDSMETTGSMGAAYLDLEGDMYVQDNTSGYIFKIQRPDLYGATNVSFFSIGPSSAWNDGAYCRGSRVMSARDYGSITIPLNVFPNPASTSCTVKLPPNEENGYLTLSDTQGRVLFVSEVSPGEAEVAVDLSTLIRGVYLVEYFSSMTSRRVSRLVVE